MVKLANYVASNYLANIDRMACFERDPDLTKPFNFIFSALTENPDHCIKSEYY